MELTILFDGFSGQHSAPATPCDPELTSHLKLAARSAVSAMSGRAAAAAAETPVLMSGAGHDAMAMARLTKVRLSTT
jgi:allantoate deiminase